MAKKKVVVKKNKFIRFLLLLIPLILAISILVYIRVVQTQNIGGSELFSPVNSRPLVVSIIIFMAGYVFFLLMMFSEEMKTFFMDKAHHR